MSVDDLSEPVKEAVRQSVDAFSAQTLDRLIANHFRCRTLVDIHLKLVKMLGSDAAGVQDVLRAAVVLLHASVEDMLRTAAVALLPAGSPAGLESIYWPSERPKEKANVGVLAEYRGRTVDEVLAICVDAHLARQTFNNSTDVMSLLRQLGFSAGRCETFRPFLGPLDAMMKRRHQIVHRADWDAASKVEPVAVEDVVAWLNSVEEFGRAFFLVACAEPVSRAALRADLAAANPPE